jgi:hypothetical protein
MQITLTAPGPETIQLTGAPLNAQRAWTAAYDLRILADITVQPVRKPRATHARLRDLGGLTTTISFSTQRTFDTTAEAVAWCADLHSIPRAGTLNLITGSGTRTMVHALLDKPDVRPTGCTVTATFTARGGAITTPT